MSSQPGAIVSWPFSLEAARRRAMRAWLSRRRNGTTAWWPNVFVRRMWKEVLRSKIMQWGDSDMPRLMHPQHLLICLFLYICYIVILPCAMLYFFNSFTSDLPWATCGNWWNTPTCYQHGENSSTCSEFPKNASECEVIDAVSNLQRKDTVIEYWESILHGISTGMDGVGGMQWELAGILFLSCLLVCFCIWKAIKSSGKVAYFTGENLGVLDSKGQRDITSKTQKSHSKQWKKTEEKARMPAQVNKSSITNDELHRLIREEDIKKVKEAIDGLLPDSKTENNERKSFVNSEEKSALHTAASAKRYEVCALLTVSGFECTNEEEEEEVKRFLNDPEYRRSLAKWFLPCSDFIDRCGSSVEKMTEKTFLLLNEEFMSDCAVRVNEYFHDINEVKFVQDILQCVQLNAFLRIVLDPYRSNIGRIYPFVEGHARGLYNLETNIIYAGIMESSSEKFELPDVLSNLIHELAHCAFSDAFGNGGLPYRKGDEKTQGIYEKVVNDIYSKWTEGKYDPIIARALKTHQHPPVAKFDELSRRDKELIMYELIVRIPEIMVKYKQSGWEILKEQVPALLKFYMDVVVPAMRKYIEERQNDGEADGSKSLKTLWRDDFDILWAENDINAPFQIHGKNLLVMEVSEFTTKNNKKIYLPPSLQDMYDKKVIKIVDWTKYMQDESDVLSAVDRLDVTTLIILWDSHENPLCKKKNEPCTFWKCPGNRLQKIVERVVLVVPS